MIIKPLTSNNPILKVISPYNYGSNVIDFMNGTYLSNLSNALINGRNGDNAKNFIYSIKYYPFKMDDLMDLSSERFLLLGGNLLETSFNVKSKTYTNSNYVNSKLVAVFPSSAINYYNNFIDYKITKYHMYLPFCGYVDLPNEKIIGKAIHVYYSFDLMTGDCNASIVAYTDSNNQEVILTKEGNCAIDISFITTNQAQINRNAARNIISLAGGLASASLLGSLGNQYIRTRANMLEINSLTNCLTNSFDNRLKVSSGGSISSGMLSNLDVLFPYLIIERPNLVFPAYNTTTNRINYSDYAHLYGVPCGKYLRLSQLQGFTKISDVHLEIDNASETELTEIERLLKQGIII